jgi:hypothetical protein
MYKIISERVGTIGDAFHSDDPVEIAWLLDGGFIQSETPTKTAKKAAEPTEES